MIKSELVQKLASQYPDLRKRDIELAVATILETFVRALERGERVKLRQFGTFTVRRLNDYGGRDPRNGRPLTLKPRVAVRFKMGLALSDRMKRSGSVPAPKL